MLRGVAIERQESFEFRTWGGKRDGSGRKRARGRRAIPHRPREEFRPSQPVHVTQRMADHVWNLRSQRSFAVIHAALAAARRRDDLRVVEYTILGNHLHLIAEANGRRGLSNGMRALGIRLARGLNAMMGRKGPVFEDRYHAHVLRSPAEVRNALRYVRGNFANHAARRGEPLPPTWVDPFSSEAGTQPRAAQGVLWPEPATREAGTWLLRMAGREVGRG
jgi:REP element-mobilizing transposase RayT